MNLQQKMARIQQLESDRAASDRGDRAAGSPSRSFSAIAAGPKSFKKGGKVKKTGIYKLHKGEKVVTAKQAKRPASKLRGRRI